MRKKRKLQGKKEGYTLAEMRIMTRKLIDESVERLRKEIRAGQLKKTRERRAGHIQHGVTV